MESMRRLRWLLQSGRVIVAGGTLDAVEQWNPNEDKIVACAVVCGRLSG